MQVPPSFLDRIVPSAVLRREGVLLSLAAWAFLVSIPLSLGELGLSSDALNHHLYLGWTAEQHRFDRDFLGAGYQTFQAPYLYWPFYRMAIGGWSGAAAGALLASLHVLAIWPLWMLARACMPGQTVFDVLMRALAVALALLSGLVLSAFGTSMTDVLGAIPLVWAVALAMEPVARGAGMPLANVRCYVALSGLCAGLAVALKLGNGPLAVLLPALWLLCGRGWMRRLGSVLLGSVGVLAGFLLGYGYWGWLLWRHFGNPVYPFYDHWFAPLRGWLGWAG